MLNKTKEKLDDMIIDYPEYAKELIRLKPFLEVATDLAREKIVSIKNIRCILEEVRAKMDLVDILSQFN
jgi:type III secretory pathway component EscV